MNQTIENPREARGFQIAQSGGIVRKGMNLYKVPAQGGSGTYTVNFGEHEPTCDCPDCQTRHVRCKHQFAVEYFLKFEKDNQGNMTVTETKRITYPQNWKAYNKAQTSEVESFDNLLKDLVSSVEEPERDDSLTGRKPISFADGLFCSIQKVYSQLSSRRAHSLYRSARGKEQIDKAPNFNAINKFLNKENITPVLQELLKLSALPLKSVETQFAVDSSGFRTTRFNEYCRHKHHTKGEHNWVKAHIMVGVKTNTVVSAEITHSRANDSPYFEPLVKRAHEDGFSLNEVSADKAYSSKMNLKLVDDLGGESYIPFKKNVSDKPARIKTHNRDGHNVWIRMYHYFKFRNDEFMEHYHKRSNVETTFYMIKQKFGETLKSKNEIAQKNELLCKLIAHNIVVLIHEVEELGINIEFPNL